MKFSPESIGKSPSLEKWIEKLWELVRMFVFPCSPFNARIWRVAWIKLAQRVHGGPGVVSWRASIARMSRVDYPWKVSVGAHATVCNGAWLYALDRIEIGEWASIGEDVKLLTGSHDVDSSEFRLITKPIAIGDMAWVATGAVVLPGVTVGAGAVVAAGAVVTKDVAPWTVVAGNPARIIKKRVQMELH